MKAQTNFDVSPYAAEPPFSPDGFLLSDYCLDETEKEWGVRLTVHHRQWVRFIAQFEAECQAYRKAMKAPKVANERRARQQRHQDIAKLAEDLSKLMTEDAADESRAEASLQEKLPTVDLSHCWNMLFLVFNRAGIEQEPIKVPTGRPSSCAQWEQSVLALARICIDAGGKATTGWCEHRGSRRSAFWLGLEAINAELPELVRVNVNGLAEHAHKHKWLAKLKPGLNP